MPQCDRNVVRNVPTSGVPHHIGNATYSTYVDNELGRYVDICVDVSMMLKCMEVALSNWLGGLMMRMSDEQA